MISFLQVANLQNNYNVVLVHVDRPADWDQSEVQPVDCGISGEMQVQILVYW
jgi:hypothetical protein